MPTRIPRLRLGQTRSETPLKRDTYKYDTSVPDSSKIIRMCRILAHMTYLQLGERIGVKKMTVYNWERGYRNPSTMAVVSVRQVCDARFHQLTGGGHIPDEATLVAAYDQRAREKSTLGGG